MRALFLGILTLTVVVSLLCGGLGHAQAADARGAIQGKVVDERGAALPE